MQKIVLIGAFVVMFTVFCVGQANAQTFTETNVLEEFGEIEIFETKIIADTTAFAGSPAFVGGLRTRCKRVRVSRLAESIVGLNLYRYTMWQGFCYNGQKVTSLYRFSRMNEGAWNTWYWDQHVSLNKSGAFVGTNKGAWAHWKKTVGKYDHCIFSVGCFESRLPWLSLTVRGNGSVLRATGVNSG